MSISLNDLANRLKNVESIKSSWTSGTGTDCKWWKEMSTGLIIQIGCYDHKEENDTAGSWTNWSRLIFPVAFTSKGSYGISLQSSTENCTVMRNVTNISVDIDTIGKTNSHVYWIAIGYLVSNRVKCLFKEVISYANILK